MSDDTSNLLLLFQKPLEPVFTVKDNGKTAFDLPDDYYTDRYKPIGSELASRFGDDVEKRVSLVPVAPPDLSFAEPLKRTAGFSLFNQKHKEIAAQLTKIFLDAPNAASLLSTAAYVKDRVNIYLFQYSLSVAVQHRQDTRNIDLPSIVQTFPDQFVDPSAFPKAREELALVSQENRMNIDIPLNFTATDKEAEQRMGYFREDIGVNMHHWHWHLVYPGEGDRRVVDKDRRGELFYYMHNQIINRYNVDRMCNGLERVKPLTNLRVPVPEAYFPKIIRSSNNRAYPPRHANSMLSDVNRPGDNTIVELGDIERWRDRIYQAIDQGYVVDGGGRQISLLGDDGIDILGNVIEASSLSPNRLLYGNLHNEGHNVISFVHDPDQKYLEEYGVMGDVTTAMRDPIFYRWHSFIDGVFARYKKNIAPYHAETELMYNGVTVTSVGVQITKSKSAKQNVLLTYWQRSDVDLSAGLDFGRDGNVYAQFTHLQHAPFEYTINVENSSSAQRQGTCRIFLCPINDERGTPLSFEEQRKLMLEMDKFTVQLNPGSNMIRRRSHESSVTIPYERSFRRIGSQYQPVDPVQRAQFQFCGCGWPQHMVLPKGTIDGARFNIFVMISDYDLDRVDQPDASNVCNDAASFCGLKDQKYPDKRAMGFPFDRPYRVDQLIDFKNLGTNMAIGECQIKFTNAVINRTAA
ncbi:phenoloxidase 2-like [Bradysia coprophila]|uniref:phenoloxidase 2-like n=1 Tax=Bradysia coprophila TaxID=38358 RepID=UPI00187DC1F5|nr:phenoloxidase 2-like [Bradysia coprophila]